MIFLIFLALIFVSNVGFNLEVKKEKKE